MKNFKFCPYCGHPSTKHKEFFSCPKCKKKVYLNSHPAAAVFILEDGKYTLGKRAIPPNKGKYDVIGGFLKNGEDPYAAAIREAKEEAGVKIKISDFLGFYLNKYDYQNETINVLICIFLAKIINGKIIPNDDKESIEWFDIDHIPEGIAFPFINNAIKDLQKWHKNH